ncbi:uncharacterized protein OCT59_019825 [Rhizophagus irregularis]|nr:hypothetical protein OCT59_019825 [Rhizophagus irregularis]
MPNASDNLGIFSSNFLNKAQTEEKCTEEKCTEEQDEEFHSKLYDDFNIPDNIDDFDNTNDDNNNKANNIIKDISNEKSFLSNEYIQREIQEAIQGIIQHREEKYYIVQKQIMKYHQYFIIEKYDVQNNPNLHDIRKYLWRNLIA